MASSTVANTDISLSDPAMTVDEYMILMSLGKAKGFKAQQKGTLKDKIEEDKYLENLRTANERVPGRFDLSRGAENKATHDEAASRRSGFVDGSGRGKGVTAPNGRGVPIRSDVDGPEGGFAIAAVVPFIPLIAEGIKGLIAIITAAINRKKGKGVLPPNLRFGHGAMNLQLGQEMKKRAAHYAEIDKVLSHMQGSKFWSRFIGEMKDELGYILPKIAKISEDKAESLASMAVNKAMPPSFQEQVADQAAQAVEGKGEGLDQVSSIVKPLAKWMVGQVVENVQDDPEVDKMITDELRPIEAKGGKLFSEKTKQGAKKFFAKVWKYGKRVAHAVLPKLIELGKEELPEIVDAVAKKVRLPGNYSDRIADEVKKHAPKLMDKVGDQLMIATSDASGSGRKKGEARRVYERYDADGNPVGLIYPGDEGYPGRKKGGFLPLMAANAVSKKLLPKLNSKQHKVDPEMAEKFDRFVDRSRQFYRNLPRKGRGTGGYEKSVRVGAKKKAFQVKIL